MLGVWRLDRLGRNLKHLVTLLEELQALGVAFVSLAEGIDATTPAGKLQMHILAAIAEFERARIAERVRAGLARVKAKGQRFGRRPHRITADDLRRVAGFSVEKGCSNSWRAGVGSSSRAAIRESCESRVDDFVENRVLNILAQRRR